MAVFALNLHFVLSINLNRIDFTLDKFGAAVELALPQARDCYECEFDKKDRR
jgi:hypothetical protein